MSRTDKPRAYIVIVKRARSSVLPANALRILTRPPLDPAHLRHRVLDTAFGALKLARAIPIAVRTRSTIGPRLAMCVIPAAQTLTHRGLQRLFHHQVHRLARQFTYL